MEEKVELQKLHSLFQFLVYLMVFLEILVFLYLDVIMQGDGVYALVRPLFEKISSIPIYDNLLYSKLSILLAIGLVSLGTLSRKKLDLDPVKQILLPLIIGFLLFFGSVYFYGLDGGTEIFPHTTLPDLGFMVASVFGALLIHTSMDNISKIIRSGLGKDEWNIEGESFMQQKKKVDTPYSVNIPMKFYYKKRIHKGWINVVNPPVFNIAAPGLNFHIQKLFLYRCWL